jgi:hypothetical protein
MQGNYLISDIGSCVEGEWQWNFTWKRVFFVWEESNFEDFQYIFHPVKVTQEAGEWCWGRVRWKVYILINLSIYPCLPYPPSGWVGWGGQYWANNMEFAPLKGSFFLLATLLRRLPIRLNLLRRRVIWLVSDNTYALSLGNQELELHLFSR